MKKIVMYTGDNCSKCKRAKMMFESCPVEVDLEIRNVDENEEYKKDLIRFRSRSLPTFLVETEESDVERENRKQFEMLIGFEEEGVVERENRTQFEILIGFEENMGKIMEVLGL